MERHPRRASPSIRGTGRGDRLHRQRLAARTRRRRPTEPARTPPISSRSTSAERLEELEIRDGRRQRRAYDADLVVFEETADRETVVERDRRRRSARFFARTREDLTRRKEPARRGGAVVVERAAEIAHALAADL